MAIDQALADRVRAELDARGVTFTERRMFGSLVFMVDEEIALGVRGSGGLLVRCDPADASTLERRGAMPARMGTRIMKAGWLDVDAQLAAEDTDLARWVDAALSRASHT